MPIPLGSSTQVDYFTHEFDPLDLHFCWKNATKNKNSITNGRRLENASWRKFFQMKYQLKTISPSELNWEKDTDASWLYGPFYSFKSLSLIQDEQRLSIHKQISQHNQQQQQQQHTPDHKSILKRRSNRQDLLPTQKRATSNVHCLFAKSLIKPSRSFPNLAKLNLTLSKNSNTPSNMKHDIHHELQKNTHCNKILDIDQQLQSKVHDDDDDDDDDNENNKNDDNNDTLEHQTDISFKVIPKSCTNKSVWLESQERCSRENTQSKHFECHSDHTSNEKSPSKNKEYLCTYRIGNFVLPDPPVLSYPIELKGLSPAEYDVYYETLYDDHCQTDTFHDIEEDEMGVVGNAIESVVGFANWIKSYII